MESKVSNDENQNKENPAAELIAETCRGEYMRLIDTYDKIYSKINILLVVCMAVFIAQVDSLKDNNLINNIMQANSKNIVICWIMNSYILITALGLILYVTVRLCFLLKSKKIPVLNCIDLRNQKVYEGNIDKAAIFLIDKYTIIMKDMNRIVEKKQKSYDFSVILVVISIILFVVENVIGKIM